MQKEKKWILPLFLSICFLIDAQAHFCKSYDIVIYGGTSAGVIAAIQGAKMGKSVVLIEPGQHLGGMTSSGLSWVDITNPWAVGGLAWKYFHRVWQHYQLDSSWKWEKIRPIKGQLFQFHPKDPLMWVLEPSVGEMIFNSLIDEEKIDLFYNERLDRKRGVKKEGAQIVEIEMESGLQFCGKMYIDASYEGDLMASSQISYIVGRESNSLYHESLNGIRLNNLTKFKLLIDPYLVKGCPDSGLLPRVYPSLLGEEGEGDGGVQAYNYRICLTDNPLNRVFIEKPLDYDDLQYEILFRAIEAGINARNLLKFDLLPNRKTDSNNSGLISTDYVGMSKDYPEADYDERQKIAIRHEKWIRGLIWTLQNHPRIPEKVRSYYAPWGLPKDEFVDNNHWPYLLYIREARRMVSSYVIHENAILEKWSVPDSIGLASYSIDSHGIKYVVNSKGHLQIDGCIFKQVRKPYPISFQAIVPKIEQCENLLVPVCLSASHVAYGSIRVEPTLMILGQSAATAASLAIDLQIPIQNLPYQVLYNQLSIDGQILND